MAPLFERKLVEEWFHACLSPFMGLRVEGLLKQTLDTIVCQMARKGVYMTNFVMQVAFDLPIGECIFLWGMVLWMLFLVIKRAKK